MTKYHICFVLAKELCSGINIDAKNYIDAVKIFNLKHGDKEIIYVSKLVL